MNNSEREKRPENPVIRSTFLTRWLFLYVTDIFRIGMKRPLIESDIYETLEEHESNKLEETFTRLWNDELRKKNPSMMRLFIRAYGWSVIGGGLAFSLFETVMRVTQPLCLGGLLSYFVPGQTDIDKETAYYYAAGIILTSVLPAVAFHPFIFFIIQTAVKMKVGSCTLMYNKILKFSKSTTFDGMNGQVINLMTNDLSKFDWALAFVHDLWKGPMEALLLGYFIYREIGVSGIIGVAFLLSFIPLQAWIGKKTATYRMKTAKRTDTRVRFMNEIIQGIQVIKMYTWEKSFAAIVDKVRRKEVNAIRGSQYIRATLLSFLVISRLSIFLSLVSYIYMGSVITARKVFIVSSFFSILNYSMVHFWPMAISSCAEGYISAIRIQKFLLSSEEKEKSTDDSDNIPEISKSKQKLKNELIADKLNNGDFSNIEFKSKNIENEDKNMLKRNNIDGIEEITELLPSRRTENLDSNQKGLFLKNATAVWSYKEKNLGIFSIDMNVESGKLCSVIGPVGCGKSTLLNVIIGELDLDDGYINVNGQLSYAAQEPWLFEGSIRRNIIFVDEYDEKRYREVCRVCALERDFELLPYRDATIVGERGMVLSGGQKARVSLARAIYKKADIYLLDDPLSAVDTHVGKHIFRQCIQNYLRDKCVILVTHQLQYLKNVEHIVLLEAGRIEAQGSFKELRSTKADSIMALTVHEEAEKETTEKIVNQLERTISIRSNFDDPEAEKETMQEGSVEIKIYKGYLKSVQSIPSVIFVSLLFILSQLALSGVDYFVAQWVNWEESLAVKNLTNYQIELANNLTELQNDYLTLEQEHINQTLSNLTNTLFQSIFPKSVENTVESVREQYIIVYAVISLFLIYIILHRNFAFFKMCLQASINLHDKLFRGVTRSTMGFFTNNPSGRILNRFSKDIGALDSFLPNSMIDSVMFFTEMIAITLLVSIINPWLLIPTGFMTIFMYMIRVVYIKTSRCVNRIESLSRSPMYSHTNATIQGLSTIRAFKAQNILKREFNKFMDTNTGASYIFYATTRAFALWLDIICVTYIAIVTLSFLIVGSDALGGNVGLVISQVVALVGMCQWGLRQTAELENKMVSVERVMEYANLPSEPPLETLPKYRPPSGWPEFGAVVFNNLSLRYTPDGEYVLKNLNFSIKPKEKIGIVGRTGAGKSSIVQAIFRLAEIDGKIEVDGIDTKTLGLHDLRSKIAIIPQDPILFSGTMRNNLDPFSEKKDEDLWSALEQVELKLAISSLAGGLDCKMNDGGSNFSMGQRQLVCLARAILRNNRILILDEATANVDPETDKLIQNTIRNKFKDCTVLTIAHRLHTVMDSDRVLVMDAGQVMEFGHPYDLLQRPGGHLRQLVDQTGQATSDLLTSIARDIYNEKSNLTKSQSFRMNK